MNSSKPPKQFDIGKFNYTYSSETRKRTARSSEPEKPKRPKKIRKWPKRLFILLLIALVLSVICLGLGYYLIDSTTLKGEEEGRVNFVLSGIDDAAKLSDTLMIVSLDTTAEEEIDYKAAMISVPRDLYVDIPPFGSNKINAAYSLGEANETSGGGLGLVRTTVEETFAVDVHYQVALDFEAFKDMVDLVGGVEIDVPVDIRDPFYPTGDGGEQLVEFEVGVQEMDGERALQYARSRQTTTDFDRAARQQQVMLAVKEKVFEPEFALDSDKVSGLFDTFNENVETDLTNREMLRLADIGRQLKDENITRHVLDNESDNLLVASNLAGYTLSPRTGDFTEIQQWIDNIFEQSENTLPQSHEPDQD